MSYPYWITLADEGECAECHKPLTGDYVEVYVHPKASRVYVCGEDCKREHLQGYASQLADNLPDHHPV